MLRPGPGTRPAARQRRAADGGFTLVEMIITMVLVGVLAAVAMPRMFDLGAWRLRAFSDELQAHTQAMQRMAMVQRRPIVLTLNSTGVSFDYVAGGTLQTLPCPAATSPCITEAGPRTVTFNSGNSGRTVTSTGAVLPVTVSHGGTTLNLSIEAETGLIRPLP